MKKVRIFLLALIIIGIGLLATQKFWTPKLVDKLVNIIILVEDIPLTTEYTSTRAATTTTSSIATSTPTSTEPVVEEKEDKLSFSKDLFLTTPTVALYNSANIKLNNFNIVFGSNNINGVKFSVIPIYKISPVARIGRLTESSMRPSQITIWNKLQIIQEDGVDKFYDESGQLLYSYQERFFWGQYLDNLLTFSHNGNTYFVSEGGVFGNKSGGYSYHVFKLDKTGKISLVSKMGNEPLWQAYEANLGIGGRSQVNFIAEHDNNLFIFVKNNMDDSSNVIRLNNDGKWQETFSAYSSDINDYFKPKQLVDIAPSDWIPYTNDAWKISLRVPPDAEVKAIWCSTPDYTCQINIKGSGYFVVIRDFDTSSIPVSCSSGTFYFSGADHSDTNSNQIGRQIMSTLKCP